MARSLIRSGNEQDIIQLRSRLDALEKERERLQRQNDSQRDQMKTWRREYEQTESQHLEDIQGRDHELVVLRSQADEIARQLKNTEEENNKLQIQIMMYQEKDRNQ